MKQLHIVHDISIRSGGLGLAALRYAQAVAKAGANATLFVANRTADELDFRDSGTQFAVLGPTLHASGVGWSALWAEVKAVRHCLCLIDDEFDVVHLHGTWSPILAISAYMARSKNIPFIVSPHGCLEPWALGHRKFKKQVALAVYQRRVLKNAIMLVATAGQELESIRALGLTCPVAVLPNGVDLVAAPKRYSSSVRRILFLSRIHPQKGLGDLVMAWARVRQPGWQVVIAGPSEGGYEDEIKLLIRKHDLEGDFYFPGLVSGEKKERCFAEADVFILPTYSENFGIAVAEALARGVPVITTTRAPWQVLETHHCGWWVAPGVDGVAAGLSEAMAMPRDALAEMGVRGKKLVEEKYSWDRIGRDALRASEWMLRHLGPRPDCINLARGD
jgi:glycosyltransferase involved in cell wall biosynthesis